MTQSRIAQPFAAFNRPPQDLPAFELLDALSFPLAQARALAEIALSDHFMDASVTTKFNYLSALDDVLAELDALHRELIKRK